MKKLLIVSDGKAGHENQSKAFCQALGYPYDCVEVSYPWRVCKMLSFVADRFSIFTERLFKLDALTGDDYYAAVVCAGSGAFYPGKVMARRLGAPVAAILYPGGYRLSTFDCIMAPAFDQPPSETNIIRIPINLTAVDMGFYADAAGAFRQRHAPTSPAVGVVIGGPTPFSPMTAETLAQHLDALFKLTEGRERWVTTSRRTPAWADEVIARYPFDYALVYRRDATFNPIPAFVTLCERLFVTADSTGMISEAVTCGTANVEVLAVPSGKECKFARFLGSLAASGAIHTFDGTLGTANAKIDLSPVFEQARHLLRL